MCAYMLCAKCTCFRMACQDTMQLDTVFAVHSSGMPQTCIVYHAGCGQCGMCNSQWLGNVHRSGSRAVRVVYWAVCACTAHEGRCSEKSVQLKLTNRQSMQFFCMHSTTCLESGRPQHDFMGIMLIFGETQTSRSQCSPSCTVAL